MPAAAVLDAITNLGQGTVTTGGTTAPVAGTSESWTISATAAFPAVSAAGGTQFRFIDPALPGEVMIGTSAPGGTGAGQSWTVTRGAEGTTPVSHTAGFTINEAVTAGFLSRLAQGQADGTGQVALVYSTAAGGTGLVAAAAAAAGTDGNANAYGAGWTGPARALQPGVTPAAVEGWHTLAPGASPWAASGNGVNGVRYKLLADSNMVLIEWDITVSATGTQNLAVMPAGYRPTLLQSLNSGSYGTAVALTTGNLPHINIQPGAATSTFYSPAACSLFGTAIYTLD